MPLSTFASLRTTTEPRELKKFQQLNAVRIQGVIPPPVPLDQALGFLENEATKILPQGFTIDYAGESRQLRTEGGKFLGTFLLSAILIYLVLAAQFESFRDPFIVLAGSVPLAVSGALLFSFLGLTTLNIYSQVGLITLVGPGVEERHPDRRSSRTTCRRPARTSSTAVIEAAATRLRPILMTTAATVVGHFPLVLATGPGAGARNSIGIMLVSGMIIGTIFTLFVVPSIYMLVARNRVASSSEPGARAGAVTRTGGGCMKMIHRIHIVAARLRSIACCSRRQAPAARLRKPIAAGRRCRSRSTTRSGARSSTIPTSRSSGSERRSRRRASARAAARTRRVFSTTLGRSTQRDAAVELPARRPRRRRNDWFSSTGVRQRLPWGGGTWSLSWDARGRRRTIRSAASIPSPAVGLSAGVFPAAAEGSHDRFGATAVRHRQAEPASSELRFRESVVQTIAAVKQAYWTLKAHTSERHRAAAIAATRRRSSRARTEIRVDAGQIPPLDLVQAEAEVAQRRENLIRANTGDGDAEDRAAAAHHGSGRRVVLAGPPRSGRGAAGARQLPDIDAAVAKALGERYDLARASNELENAEDRRRIPRQPAAARRPARNVLPRQRTRRHAVHSQRRISGGRRPGRATAASATRSARRSDRTTRRGASASP